MHQNHRIACHECDLLIELPSNVVGSQKLVCPRCHHLISSGHNNPLDTVNALGLTAILVLMMSISQPFLSFAAQGQSTTISLIQASTELYAAGFYVLALLVMLYIVILPLMYLIFLLAITLPVWFGWKNPAAVKLGMVVNRLLPWSMAEVFVVAVLVSLIKVVAMADIIFGFAFWSYILFSLMFTYLTSVVDAHRLWHWVDGARGHG